MFKICINSCFKTYTASATVVVLLFFNGLSTALFYMAKSLIFALNCISSSIKLHHGMLLRTMQCPMYVFDTTPVGRILNRFTRDVDAVDNVLPERMRNFLDRLFTVIALKFEISVICAIW